MGSRGLRRSGDGADIADADLPRPDRDHPHRPADIIDSAGYAIVTKTLDGIVTTWNKAAEALYGYAAEEMIGRPAAVLTPAERAEQERALLERVARDGEGEDVETFRRRKD